jgi:hypothetical protein
MRALLVVVLALGTLWGGYWVVGSIALQKAAEGWFEQQAVAGRDATNSAISVQGFPNRFDLTVSDLHLADPVSGMIWDAPFVQVFSMTWKPWHLIAALPNSQTITTPVEVVTLGSTSLKGSLVLVPGTALTLDRIVVEGADLDAKSSLGWVVKAGRVQLSTRQDATVANGHEVSFVASGLIPDPGLMAAIAGTSDLPPLVETAQIDFVAGFSAPIDRFVGKTRPVLSALTLKEGVIRWGDMVLTTKGSIVADAEGLAEGRIDIRLQNWRKALAPAIGMGLIKPEVAPTVERMMELMAQQSGDATVLDLPLVMKAGRMSLGPLPLGPAPRLIVGPQG